MKTMRSNGLQGQQAHSPGQRPGYKAVGKFALQGQKHKGKNYAFAPVGRGLRTTTFTQGVALGWGLVGRSFDERKRFAMTGRLC